MESPLVMRNDLEWFFILFLGGNLGGKKPDDFAPHN